MLTYQVPLGHGIAVRFRYLLAGSIFLVALALRFLVLPVESGLAFLTFYPGTAIVALFCGVGPSLFYILLSGLIGGYIFLPPFWAFHQNHVVPVGAFFVATTMILLVINFYQRRIANQSKVLTKEVLDRKQLASQLQKSLDRISLLELEFRQTFTEAAVGIAHVSPDGRCLRTNQKLADIVGYSCEELLTKSFQEITHPEDLEPDLANVQKLLAGEIDTYSMEKRYLRKNGSIVWTNLTVSLVRFPEGGPDHFISVVKDITERKRAEEEILQLNADLERRVAERTQELERSNRDLDDFAYIASHDLKEPLRGLHNYASFLKEDYESVLDDEGKKYLDRMQRLVERLTALIDGLLDYSRLGSSALLMESVNLNLILDDVAEDLKPFLHELGVKLVRTSPLPTVFCNALRVREVFQNLITNAAKYNDKSEKWVEVSVNQEQQPVFCVRDNGIGIALQHQDSIFRIFKRLHEQNKFGGGTGAGLTIVKKIVEHHGGHVWLESTPGTGSCFYFTLQGKP